MDIPNQKGRIYVGRPVLETECADDFPMWVRGKEITVVVLETESDFSSMNIGESKEDAAIVITGRQDPIAEIRRVYLANQGAFTPSHTTFNPHFEKVLVEMTYR